MKWTRLYVRCSLQAQEAVSNLLLENGAGGIQIDDAPTTQQIVLATYFDNDEVTAPLIEKLTSALERLKEYGLDPGTYQIGTENLDDSQWSNEWKKYYHAQRISRYLAIAPSWESIQDFDDQTKVIRLDPGKSFGTGTHPTTILALHALEASVHGQKKMIDVGTGSGVLSIAAKYLGVEQVDAYDVDDESIKAAQENFNLNPLAKDITLKKNSLLDGVTGQVELIVANILAEIIVPLIPQAAAHLQDQGTLILSGIIADKLPLIEETLQDNGFVVKESLKMKDWYGVIAVVPQDK